MRSLGLRVCLTLPALMIVICVGRSNAGFERRYAGARALGIGGALSSIGEDCWSFYFNPARAADLDELNFFYSPSTFGLSEVKSTGLAVRGNLWTLGLGAAAQTFGYELYRETVYTVNLSRPVTDFLFLGCNVNLNHLFIKGYGTDLSGSLDFGAKVFLSQHIVISAATTNVNSASMTLSNDRLPQTLTCGCGFVSEKFNVEVDYFKELGFPSAIRMAAEYSPMKEFTVRGGTVSGTNSLHAGMSLRLFSVELEYGMAYHQFLGITHSVGLSIRIHGLRKSEFESIDDYRRSLK